MKLVICYDSFTNIFVYSYRPKRKKKVHRNVSTKGCDVTQILLDYLPPRRITAVTLCIKRMLGRFMRYKISVRNGGVHRSLYAF